MKAISPEIIFPIKILAIMRYIVNEISTEAGWLGSVSHAGNLYVVDELFIPGQQVDCTTCEFTGNSVLDLGEAMEKAGKGDKIGRLRFWGHSHHSMGISPSTQDEEMAEKLTKDCQDYFIRAICNKAGEMSITFYDLAHGLSILNAPWYIDDGVDRAAIQKEFKPILDQNVKGFTTYDNKDNGAWPSRFSKFVKRRGKKNREFFPRSVLIEGRPADASELLKTT
jgi:hypothetical protein